MGRQWNTPAVSEGAAEAIAYVIQRFESGQWQWGQAGQGVCVALAINRAHAILGTEAPTMNYLADAMRERRELIKHPGVTYLEYLKGNPIRYNDAEGRTLEDIISMLRNAKDLAEGHKRGNEREALPA